MSIITLLTDFGSEDAYVGMMKGVILSINPSAVIVDISHHIDPQDIIQAAYTLKSSYTYFPEGTVHIVVVDPGVGSDRAIIALEMSGHVFLAPDNGVLTLLMDEGKIDAIVRVEDTRYTLDSVSQTFHGRDIFAPVGAHISRGAEMHRLGSSLNPKNLFHLDIPKPYISDTDELTGKIISVDRFGNCISNIDVPCFKKFTKVQSEKRLEIKIGKNIINNLSRSYNDVGIGCPLAIIGGFGYLEIALNCGNAGRSLHVEKGDFITLKLRQEQNSET
jgi:S-adenosyl-L-methionine hydrolase (adenosine-forming)